MSGFTGTYGEDSAVLPRVDLTFTPLRDDGQILLNDFYKLLTTPQGYVWWSPDTVTMDVRELIYDSTTDADRAATQQRIEAVLLGDPRVEGCEATVTFDHPTGVLRIDVVVTAVEGFTFRFLLTVAPDSTGSDTSVVTIERVQ